jgi:DNA-binding LacI/PurR family transcriptional regulator
VVFVQNDGMALGALRALAERGLRVSADCSLVSCDDPAFGECLAGGPVVRASTGPPSAR